MGPTSQAGGAHTLLFRRPVSPGSGLGFSTVRWGVTCRLAVSVVWHIPGMDARRAGMQAAPRWAVRAVGVRPLVVVWLGWARGGILASTHTLRVAYGI